MTNKKFTLDDLLPINKEVTIKHPHLEGFEQKITLRSPKSEEVKQQATIAMLTVKKYQSELAKLGEDAPEEDLARLITESAKATIPYVVAAIVTWDEEGPFGKFSKEDALGILSRSELEFAVEQITEELKKQEQFFR